MICKGESDVKYSIMLSILFELLSNKSVSATYLADKYEISTRSVYRYLEDLEDAGVPLYTTRGRSGGISLVDTYRLSSTFMTIQEFEQTISALTAINDGVDNKVLESAILKLKSAVRKEFSRFNIESGNLIIDGGSWGDTIGYKTKLKVVQEAIDQNRKLSITYHDRNGINTIRTIDPHFILFKQGLWYTYAYCNMRETFRLFKIGRIESATILSETFQRKNVNKSDIDFEFWDNNPEAVDVTMEISPSCISDVEEWLGVENVKDENGIKIARAKLPFDNGLISKIMGFGKGIKVLAPAELKNEIKKNAEELIKNY